MEVKTIVLRFISSIEVICIKFDLKVGGVLRIIYCNGVKREEII